MILDPLQDSVSAISLLQFSGGDLEVVNDAKASFDNIATSVGEREEKLLGFLINPIAEPQHTSPLRGTSFKFQVKCPLFVARQWWKHTIASTFVDEQNQWNEMSLRYKEMKVEGDYYTPKVFKEQASVNKQASAEPLDREAQEDADWQWHYICGEAYAVYKQLIEMGVSREQARGVLPPAFYTSFRWTVSLQSVLHFIDLREGHGAQPEITAYATAVRELIAPYVPVVLRLWDARKVIIKDMVTMYNHITKEERS